MPTTLKDTDFTAAPDTPQVGAGLELYDDWYDILGNAWSIASGKLTSDNTANSAAIDTEHLLLDSALTSGVSNQQLIVEWIWPADNVLDIIPILRKTGSTTFYKALFYFGGCIFQKLVGGSETTLSSPAFDQTIVTGNKYRATFTLNGTSWSIALYNVTAGSALTWSGQPTASVTDSSISAAGEMGISSYRANSITRLAAINLDGTPTTLTATPTSLTVGAVAGGSVKNIVEVVGEGSTFTSLGSPVTLTNAGGTNASITDTFVIDDELCYLEIDAGTVAGTVTLGDQTGTGTDTVTLNANTATNQVVFCGDSFVALVEVLPENQTMLGVCLANLGPTWTGERVGGGGRTVLPGSGNQIPYDDVPATLAGRNFLWLQGGINDIAIYSSTPADIYAGFLAHLATFDALGWDVGIVTVIPYGGVVSGKQDEVDALNELIRDNALTDGFAAVCDLAGYQPFSNTSLAPFNQNYYYADKVHPQIATHEIWGEDAAAKILSVTAAGGGGTPSGGVPLIGGGLVR